MVQSGSTAAISGGAITANGSVGNGVNVTSSGTATITGGTITADNRGVDVSSGTATISGGTITADSRGVSVFKGTATISGGTITADSRGVSVSSGITTITGGTITAGDWGVYASKSTTTITGGTIKSTGGAIYNESGTLLEMLGQTGGSPCAYWQGSEPVALTEGQNELPAGTYTVKECQHNGEGVCTYTHTSGATTHNQTCLACGNKWDEENCSFDENGKCACEAVLAVALKDNSELTYTGEAQTPEVNVTVDGIALAAEKYQLSYDNNINAGNTAKVTVTAVGGSFSGSASTTFTISPATPTLAWGSTTQELPYTGNPAAITAPKATGPNGIQLVITHDTGPCQFSYAKQGGSEYKGGLPTDAGIYTIKARVEAKGNYAAAESTNTLTLTINKAAAPTITWPAANDLTYGQKLSESTLSGGSTEYGSFAWAKPDTVPTAGTSGYSVTFTPSDSTVQNYEPITTTTQDVDVTVAQATPTVTVAVKMSDSANSRVADLIITVAGAQNGAAPAGSITLTSDGLNETLTLQNGKAAYKWENLSDKEYTVTAAYSGDTNYKAANGQLTFDAAKKEQTISIDPIEAKTYGDAAFTLTVKDGIGTGAVSFTSSDPSIISINGSTAVAAHFF